MSILTVTKQAPQLLQVEMSYDPVLIPRCVSRGTKISVLKRHLDGHIFYTITKAWNQLKFYWQTSETKNTHYKCPLELRKFCNL